MYKESQNKMLGGNLSAIEVTRKYIANVWYGPPYLVLVRM